MDPLTASGKLLLFWHWTRICRRIRNWFAQHSSNFFLRALLHLSELDRYVPSHNYIKAFNWVRSPFEVPVLQVHCEVDCNAEQLVWAVPCKRRSLVAEVWWRNRSGKKLRCKSKKTKKSQGKKLYYNHCNFICVSSKHGMHGSLRGLK